MKKNAKMLRSGEKKHNDIFAVCSPNFGRLWKILRSLRIFFYRATACNAAHVIAKAFLSVRPSVCLSVRQLSEKKKDRTRVKYSGLPYIRMGDGGVAIF